MLVVPFDRSLLKQGKGNLFVKHIAASINNKRLYELFRVHGEIFSCKVAQDITGKSKGYGFVQYKNAEDANKAIAALNGSEQDGKAISVELYLPTDKRAHVTHGFTNVFVKNLPTSVTTKEALSKLFEPYGERTSVGIFSNKLGDKVGYFGFVNFRKPDDATKAIEAMNNKEIDGTHIYVAKALTKDQRFREKLRLKIESRNKARKLTLHVKSVANEPLEEAKVRAELSRFGEIKQVFIPKHKVSDTQEASSAVGYVVFENEDSAAKVRDETQNGNRRMRSTPRRARSS